MFFGILSSLKWLACLSKMSILEKLKSQIEQLLDLSFESINSRCFKFQFYENRHINRELLLQSFLYMNWFSMIFKIDSFRKKSVTTSACFVTSCPHDKCLYQKNWTQKLSNYMTHLKNEQIQDVFTIHFFWEQAWS